MDSTPLTDLEAAALGFVSSLGPCTAYRIRKCFLDSPSARFSGSAGAIYPLLSRLEERGYVTSSEVKTGKRPARAYAITRDGKQALRTWLRDVDPAVTFADDPLRTRMLYLSELPPAARTAWFDDAEASIRSQEARIDAFAARLPATPFVHQANENARRLNRARLRWLEAARTALDGT